MHVHAYEYLRSLKLLEGMLDAVGYVGGYAHLSLHLHVCRCGMAHQMFQQLLSLFLVLHQVGVVVDHVEAHDGRLQLGVAHHEGH